MHKLSPGHIIRSITAGALPAGLLLTCHSAGAELTYDGGLTDPVTGGGCSDLGQEIIRADLIQIPAQNIRHL